MPDAAAVCCLRGACHITHVLMTLTSYDQPCISIGFLYHNGFSFFVFCRNALLLPVILPCFSHLDPKYLLEATQDGRFATLKVSASWIG